VKKEYGELRRGKNKLKEKQFHIERHIAVLLKKGNTVYTGSHEYLDAELLLYFQLE
jgi:hypothetical protein